MSHHRRSSGIASFSTLLTIAALVFATLAGGCTVEPVYISEKIQVVATTGMIADAARVIGGERADVQGLMQAGVDPHTYSLNRNDQVALGRAQLVLYHGLHLEGKLASFLQGLRDKSATTGQIVAAVAETIPDSKLIRNELFGEYPDPHVWFDLELWQIVVGEVISAYRLSDPENAKEYQARGDAYVKKLQATHEWAKQKAASLAASKRRIVTSHDAYNYFARAYGFEVHGLQGISTETQAGLTDIEEAVKYIRKHEIPVIFAETSVNPESVTLVAKQSGAALSPKKLYSDALGKADGPEGTLDGMFRFNLSTVVTELAK